MTKSKESPFKIATKLICEYDDLRENVSPVARKRQMEIGKTLEALKFHGNRKDYCYDTLQSVALIIAMAESGGEILAELHPNYRESVEELAEK